MADKELQNWVSFPQGAKQLKQFNALPEQVRRLILEAQKAYMEEYMEVHEYENLDEVFTGVKRGEIPQQVAFDLLQKVNAGLNLSGQRIRISMPLETPPESLLYEDDVDVS